MDVNGKGSFVYLYGCKWYRVVYGLVHAILWLSIALSSKSHMYEPSLMVYKTAL